MVNVILAGRVMMAMLGVLSVAMDVTLVRKLLPRSVILVSPASLLMEISVWLTMITLRNSKRCARKALL